ncbi:hypothetical protein AAVH_27379 [Aphelenchoides avenae]|nr:hypothetical protein AAVH_27379 [Aphelenchus avenae]
MTTLTTLAIVLAVYAACISVDSGVEGSSPRVRPSGVFRVRHSRSMGFDPESEKTCGLGCMVKANSQCVAIVRAIRRFKKSAALPIGDGDYQSVPSLYRNSTCPAPCAEEASRDCQDKIREVVQATCPIDDACDEYCDSIQQSLQSAERERDTYKATAAAEKRRADCAESRAQEAEADLKEVEKALNETTLRVEELSRSVTNLQNELKSLKDSCNVGANQPQAEALADTDYGQDRKPEAEELPSESAANGAPKRHVPTR